MTQREQLRDNYEDALSFPMNWTNGASRRLIGRLQRGDATE